MATNAKPRTSTATDSAPQPTAQMLPGFPGKLPQFAGKLPSVDLDSLFGLVRANVTVGREAQDVLIEAAQAIAKLQQDWFGEVVAKAQNGFRLEAPKNPTAALAEVQSAAERALAVSSQSFELGAAAQRRVADLVTQRAAANAAEVKSLIAA